MPRRARPDDDYDIVWLVDMTVEPPVQVEMSRKLKRRVLGDITHEMRENPNFQREQVARTQHHRPSRGATENASANLTNVRSGNQLWIERNPQQVVDLAGADTNHRRESNLNLNEGIGLGGGMTAYCVKCRQKQPMKDAKKVKTKNNRSALKGQCSKCGTKMMKFV
jgi:hypothetical protein